MTERKRERHGMSKTPTYHTWAMLKQRCLNKSQTAFSRYGGRAITVCDRWQNSFAAFLEDMGERPEGMTLDRIDNDGDYCPENCRWATPKEQANNTRRTRYVAVDGKRRLATEVARENGIAPQLVSARIENGWTTEEAVGLEKHIDGRAINIDGEAMTMAQWAKKMGISRQAMQQRVKNGWDIQDALTTPLVDVSLRAKARGVEPRKLAKKTRISSFGGFITERRLELALTQKHVADYVGVPTAVISSYEMGKTLPSLKSAMRLAKTLAVSLDDMVSHLG